MSRITDYLRLIDNPTEPPLAADHADDPPLLSLLVHLAAVDGVVQGDEFALLQRVRADLDPGSLLAWASDVASRPLDLDALRTVMRSEDDRWDVLRFAARMVAMDGVLAEAEISRLDEIVADIGLPASAAGQVLDEVVALGGAVSEQHLRDALRNMWWDVLVPRHEGVIGALAAVVPEGVTALCAIWFGEQEVAGLYVEGLAACFDSGPAFVRWEEVRYYTRVPVPGAAFHLRTHDGLDHAATPGHLRDLGALVDLVYGRSPTGRERV